MKSGETENALSEGIASPAPACSQEWTTLQKYQERLSLDMSLSLQSCISFNKSNSSTTHPVLDEDAVAAREKSRIKRRQRHSDRSRKFR